MAVTANLTPIVIHAVNVPAGRVELVEWHWPDILDFTRVESDLMVEMSLPPMAADGSACFPEIDPEKRCFMGTLFVRWPEIKISGRSEGGHICVVRCVFAPRLAARLLAIRPTPDHEFLQSLLAIRSNMLRSIMRLLHLELTNPVDRSNDALAALMDLVVIELVRIFERTPLTRAPSRLAAWQFRRIRARIAKGAAPPTVAELAEICGISPRHLHRQFLALTGKTVANYIADVRIEDAKRLLAARDRPIKAIAQNCGFTHANSFARAFRRSTGLTPHDFRQRSFETTI